MTKPDEVSGLGGDAFPSASRGDRPGCSSPVDPQSDLISREGVRELLRAMATRDLIRLERVSRYSMETHWRRLDAASARIKAIEEELGL